MREMPETQAPDDIFALFSQFDLDISQYRVFQRENLALESSADLLDSDQIENAPVTEAEVEISATFLPEPEPARPMLTHPRLMSRPDTSLRTPPPSALNSLGRTLRASRENSTGNVSRAVAVSIVGAAGGVGVTTIAATLARQLTKDGGRCGLYDTAPDSLLPVYFGNQQIATNQHRFAGLHSVLQPSIRFLSPDACANLESIVSAEALSPLEKLARHFAHEFEHVIFDSAREDLRQTEGVKIYVAIPDVGSVIGIQRLMAHWTGTQTEAGAICVLNRFDNSLALHQELRCWYEERFTEVVTIDNCYSVPEALAEGATVVDWAPHSDAAGDFMRLAGCVRRFAQNSSSNSASLAHQTQSEGLALCS